MSKLPLITAKELIKILLKLGFDLKRQKGSHKFFQHKDGRTTVIPDHGTEQLDRGLLNKIIKQDLMITVEAFLKIKQSYATN
jgi:predicted RNA binding protein YcfA (HicA-like mRNA interferase family)